MRGHHLSDKSKCHSVSKLLKFTELYPHSVITLNAMARIPVKVIHKQYMYN